MFGDPVDAADLRWETDDPEAHLAIAVDDADAWYGLGEAWFHDTAGTDQSPAWTRALRAFKRTLALDPDYALAYDHVHAMLTQSAISNPQYALLPGDSFAVARTTGGRRLIDTATVAAAVQRARAEALNTARSWVASQPATLRAQAPARVEGNDLVWNVELAPRTLLITVVNVGAATGLSASAPAGTYFVRVVAMNAFGGSGPSNEADLSDVAPRAGRT